MSVMKYIAVDTVGDEGAAAVASEALGAAGIAVEIRRVRGNVYEPRRMALEVRVPADEVVEARAILAALSTDATEAAEHETSDLAHGAPLRLTTPPPALRPLLSAGTLAKLAMALLLMLLVFFFGFTP